MKTIILFLFISISIFGQSNLLLLMGDGYKNPETTLYLAGQTVTPTQAARIDQFITKVKDSLQISLLSQKFDVMYLLANESAALGLRNLVKRSHDATAVNSPTFTQWEGFTGANTKYLNTNYKPSSNGVAYTQNSASFGVYVRTDVQNGFTSLGAIDASNLSVYFAPRVPVNTPYVRINQATTTSTSLSLLVADGSGLFIISRTASDLSTLYRNGVQAGDAWSTASNALVNLDIYLLSYNNNGSATSYDTGREYAFFFFGAGLTATEVSKLYNCIQWYMTQLGKQV